MTEEVDNTPVTERLGVTVRWSPRDCSRELHDRISGVEKEKVARSTFWTIFTVVVGVLLASFTFTYMVDGKAAQAHNEAKEVKASLEKHAARAAERATHIDDKLDDIKATQHDINTKLGEIRDRLPKHE